MLKLQQLVHDNPCCHIKNRQIHFGSTCANHGSKFKCTNKVPWARLQEISNTLFTQHYVCLSQNVFVLQKIQRYVQEQEERAQAARDRLAAWQARCHEEAELEKQLADALETVQQKRARLNEATEQLKQRQEKVLEQLQQRQAEALVQHEKQQVCL